MGKRKVVRTQKEEEEFQKLKRERMALNQQKYREKKNKIVVNNIVWSSNDNLPSNNNNEQLLRTDNIIDLHQKDMQRENIANIAGPSNNNLLRTDNGQLLQKHNIIDVHQEDMQRKNIMNIEPFNNSLLSTELFQTHNITDLCKKNVQKEKNVVNCKAGPSNKSLSRTDKQLLQTHPTQHTLSEGCSEDIQMSLRHLPDMCAVRDNDIYVIKKLQNSRAKFKEFQNIDFNNLNQHYIGKMNVECQHCRAKHFHAEKVYNKGNSFNDCCSHGKVILESLPPLPDELQQLFSGNHKKSKEFLTNLRGYNSAFSFASFNTKLVHFNAQRRGPYCFKIQGQIYYQINTALYPTTKEQSSYGQLFILDANEATECRLNANSNLDEELLHILDNIIRSNNIFAQSYQMMHEVICDQENLGLKVPDLTMGFLNKKTGIDRGRYNVQRTNEVAAIFSTFADGDIPDCYVTIRNKHDKILKYVSTMDPNVEPWIYPMYYPHGTHGWHDNIKQINGKRVTRSMYIQYRMAIRDNVNIFLMGKRLFQQWLVDSYVKIEKDRINWCKENQKKLRVEKHKGLIDYLERKAIDVNARVGRVMILPSTFIGSPRNMMQNYQDAMAIVRKYGKPDVFITMTCNPNWLEIKENLLPNQQPADRPDICARVFDIKKNYLMDVIIRQKLFGEVKAFVYVIEFQKRGLPHVHILITLKQYCKITDPETVDKYISAEIPDPAIDKNLHEIVMKNMIHGPCADWCMVNGKCSKRFPKPFHEETTMDENGYPQYRRRDTSIFYEKPGGFVVDNRFVVSYCPILSTIFNCHINVEIVSTIKSVKYLYKYIYKGHDAASVVIGENVNNIEVTHDEINDFIEARYVGPVEAYWRITGKTLQEKSHAIIRLPVHLPNEQNVIIHNHSNEQDLRSALERITMLMDYFELNKRDVDARQYVYTEIPLHYVFKKIMFNGKQISRWEKRQSQFNCIGRMYSVSPTEIELFHLRILLLNVKGATSYNDLKTVNGMTHQTFTSTCLALGLIEDDDEWKRAMSEASLWMMPRRLRLLFVRILMHCQPLHPRELWHEFQFAMSEDYIRRFGRTTGIKKAYVQIDQLLRKESWNLSQFPEMEQVQAEYEKEDAEELQREALLGQQQYNQLNNSQKNIVDYILNLLKKNDNHQIKCLYIDGPGGSGKTFVYTTLYYLLKSQGKIVSTMAFTGIAATLLPNGKTAHKILGLPVPLFDNSTSNIKVQSKEADYLKKTDVFIWDEAPMAPRYALEVMNHLLQDLMQNNIPFGGKIVILGGDFRQLLPVKQNATRSEIVSLSIKFSSLWQHFKIFSLTENMRILPHEQEFAQFLLDLGNGILNDQLNNVEVPLKCVANSNENIVRDTYDEIIKQNMHRLAAKRAILSARNVDVDELNKQVVNLLDESTERVYTSIDTTETTDDNNDINEAILPEYLNTLNPTTFPPHELRLRKYTVIMLIRNLNISEGLCNGTRLIILELGNNLLKCEILTGDKKGEIVFLNRITLYCEDIYPFVFKRRQFPIKIAFAMTINKSQGQTFDKIAIDLRKDVFTHGQLYVAFSRVRSWESLKIYLDQEKQSKLVKNYVYTEIFQ